MVLLMVLHYPVMIFLGLVKDEELQRAGLEQERALEKLRCENDREKHTLQKQHAADLETQMEKTNSKLKTIGELYGLSG